jgi:hypothetical protein
MPCNSHASQEFGTNSVLHDIACARAVQGSVIAMNEKEVFRLSVAMFGEKAGHIAN